MSDPGGPYIQMAVICEKVLEEKDGVLSVIRVVDRFTISASGPTPPEEMPPGSMELTIVVTIKAGFARGRYNLRVVPKAPSGKQLTEFGTGILVEGDDRGANVVLRVRMEFREEGLYWFDVLLQDQLITRIPLRLLYQRVTQGRLPLTG